MSQERRTSQSARSRSFEALRCALLVLAMLAVIGLDRVSTTAHAQAPAGETSDREPQTLHGPDSVENGTVEAPAAEPTPSPPAAVPPTEPSPKRDLLGEKIEQGEASEAGPLAFDEDGIPYVLITTKPHGTRTQARNELDRLMLDAANERYKAAVSSPRVMFWFPLDLAGVRSELLLPDGERILPDHEGKYVGHALLGFAKPFELRLRAVRVASRSMQIVAAGGATLALMMVAFAFLRLDRATRGLYTGRLQTWAVVACAVVACVTGVVAYWIPWI